MLCWIHLNDANFVCGCFEGKKMISIYVLLKRIVEYFLETKDVNDEAGLHIKFHQV